MKYALSTLALGLSLVLTACGGAPSPYNVAAPLVINPNTDSTNTGGGGRGQPTVLAEGMPTHYNLWSEEYTEQIMTATGADDIDPAISVDGEPSEDGKLDLSTFDYGLSSPTLEVAITALIEDEEHEITSADGLRIYKQPNSIVLGRQSLGAVIEGPKLTQEYTGNTKLTLELFGGNGTKTLPTTGLYSYVGTSFDHDSEGSFEYNINFDTKTGNGHVGLDGKTILLQESEIKKIRVDNPSDGTTFEGFGIRGAAAGGDFSGRYDLGIFGDNAEEVAGVVGNDDTLIGFGGTKQ